MLGSDVNREFLERIDEAQRSLISKMVAGTTFEVPTIASFAMGELSIDDAQTRTYSANT